MVLYHANMSPRTLSTVTRPLYEYPAHWELMRWYLCWRKVPYPTEILAWLIVQDRPPEYAHYPCTFGEPHWHIGRGGNKADPRQKTQRAKRVYRKAVRDEIRADYEEKKRVGHE